VLLLGAIVLGVGGYAFYRWRSARTTNENTSGESPAVTTESTPQPVSSTSSPVSNTNSNQSSPTTTGTPSTWEATASSLTEAEKIFTQTCSPGGTAHYVWGSDIYTADSSICTAAVHAGLITYERGGTVTIELSYEVGKTYKFKCPAGGKQNFIWGTDVYTADSSICNAAVHVGRITLDGGGKVTIELRPGQSSYQGTMRNGVKSNEYGTYAHSFVVR